MKELFDESTKELVEIGVLDCFDVTKRLIESSLNVTLTDSSKYYRWHRTYPNMKAYTVIDPTVDGSSDVALCLDFSSDRLAKPLHFCFVNVHTKKAIELSVHTLGHLRALMSINDLIMYHRNFAPFNQLTRSVYRSAVANRNGKGRDVNTGAIEIFDELT